LIATSALLAGIFLALSSSSRMKNLDAILLLALRFASALSAGPAQEWTRFRGPNGSGISPAKIIPTTWTDKEFNWKLPLPAPSHSSPVWWGDKVFLTKADDKTKQVWWRPPIGSRNWR
jgi:hypothetical protein